jgi:hypothetical protein
VVQKRGCKKLAEEVRNKNPQKREQDIGERGDATYGYY